MQEPSKLTGRPRDTTPDGEHEPWPIGLGALLASALLVALIVVRLAPPAAAPASAAPDAFSAARARVHLERIAAVPHPVGSAAARDVEAYITQALRGVGLQVESNTGPACTEAAGLRRCGIVRNVIGTLPGRTREPALLLSAHYDSVPSAPGAGDDGAAVAALLETARALAVAGVPERDVSFAFLDGEEELMLGAAGYCRALKESRHVGLVANFDARGNRGAATLVGASPGSAALLGDVLGALSHPIVNSFYPGVASVLPNATDAEIYQRCGLEALSFAFADGFETYHQGTDTAARLDDRSLQHHGSYALDIARRYAAPGSVLAPPSRGGLVFFDVAGGPVVRYSFTLARGLGLVLLAATVVVLARKRARLGVSGAALFRAAGWCGLVVLATAVVCGVVAQAVSYAWRPWSDYTHAAGLAACAACSSLGLLLLLAAYAARRGHAEVLRFGPLSLWVALAVLCAAAAPALSHLFTWPAAALLGVELLPARASRARALVRGLAGLLAALLLTPVVYALIVVVGAPGVAGAGVCLVLAFGIWVEPLARARAPRRIATSLLAGAALLAIVLRAVAASGPGPAVGNSVAYALDAPARHARWLSADPSMDDWKRLLLGAAPIRARLPSFASESTLFMSDAPLMALEAPRLELVSDAWNGAGQRVLSVRARSLRAARNLKLWEARGVQFSHFSFEGVEPLPLVRFTPGLDVQLFRWLSGHDDGGLWSVSIFAPGAEGVELSLTTADAGPLELRCTDRSEGLQGTDAPPRPPAWTEGYPGDHTLVSGAPLHVPALPR